MKDINLNILSPRISNPLLYIIYTNLVDTCNIDSILLFKCDVTKFRTPTAPLNV